MTREYQVKRKIGVGDTKENMKDAWKRITQKRERLINLKNNVIKIWSMKDILMEEEKLEFHK